MTKKDYELIAEALNYHNRGLSTVTIEALAETLATLLQAQNNKFDRTRFLQACGIGE